MEHTSTCSICGDYAPADYKGDRPVYVLSSRTDLEYRFCMNCYLALEKTVLNRKEQEDMSKPT